MFGAATLIVADTEHIVKRGDTFASIAKKYGITETELMEANPTMKNCYVGLKISIPSPGKHSTNASKNVRPIGNGYYIMEDFDRLSQEIVIEAASGNVVAIKELGDCYRWGTDLVDELQIKADPKKAMQLYLRADSLDYPYATMAIAEMYNAGTSVKRDESKAAEWYDRAFINLQKYANMNDARAMAGLAEFYVSPSIPGNGNRLDPELGTYWYKMAAKNGQIEAAQTLGFYYRVGFGVEKNETEALKWDSRFCVDADKRGWMIEGYPAYRNLVNAGRSNKTEWAGLAKDTYKEIINPQRKVETAVSVEQIAKSAIATNFSKGTTQTKHVNHSGVTNRHNDAQSQTHKNNVASSQMNYNRNNGQNHSHNTNHNNSVPVNNPVSYSSTNKDIPHVVLDGVLNNGYRNCYECGGSGSLPCPTCNGTGQVPCPMGTVVFDRPYPNPFIAIPRKIHSPNCGTCKGTQHIRCVKCNEGRVSCLMCTGKGLIVDYHILKELPTKASRPQWGNIPYGERLGYVSLVQTFRGMRNTNYLTFMQNGIVNIGLIGYELKDNGDTWILRTTDKSRIQEEQIYLAKNFSYLLRRDAVYVIWAPEDMTKQEQINQQAVAQLNALSSGYAPSPSTSGMSQIATDIKKEIAEIEARQNARAKQELRDAKLNVALTQSNREIWCPICRTFGLKHTHYK